MPPSREQGPCRFAEHEDPELKDDVGDAGGPECDYRCPCGRGVGTEDRRGRWKVPQRKGGGGHWAEARAKGCGQLPEAAKGRSRSPGPPEASPGFQPSETHFGLLASRTMRG